MISSKLSPPCVGCAPSNIRWKSTSRLMPCPGCRVAWRGRANALGCCRRTGRRHPACCSVQRAVGWRSTASDGATREVRDLSNGRSHCVAEGPAGVPVAWDAVITRSEPNRVLAWQSEPGATVANAGNIRFEPIADNRTRVTIRLSYNPPAGALGHVVAKLFGADPKSELDDDLVRLKSLFEYGKASVGRTTVTREDVDLGQAAERTPDLQARERGAEPPAPEY